MLWSNKKLSLPSEKNHCQLISQRISFSLQHVLSKPDLGTEYREQAHKALEALLLPTPSSPNLKGKLFVSYTQYSGLFN